MERVAVEFDRQPPIVRPLYDKVDEITASGSLCPEPISCADKAFSDLPLEFGLARFKHVITCSDPSTFGRVLKVPKHLQFYVPFL